MTHHLMGRPILRAVGSSAYGPTLAGVTAALVGLATTAVPVLVLWVLSPYPQDTAVDAARLVGCLWLLAHGGPLARGTAAVPLSLTPLLLTLFTVQQLYRAGARVARAGALPGSPPGARTAGGRTAGVPAAICAGYLAVALPVTLECSTAGALRARALPDLLAVAVLAYASAAFGARALPGTPRWWPPLRERLERWTGPVPGWARAAGGGAAIRRAACGGLLGLAAGGALLLALAVVLRSQATDPAVRGLTGGSVPGLIGLLLACLLLVPNAVVWSAGYTLGPGFQLGAGTTVGPGRVLLGPVPDFPLLSLVPGAASPWQYLAYAVPVLAGLTGAGLLGRAAAHGGDPARGGEVDDGASADGEWADGEWADGASAEGAPPWHPAATALAATGAALAAGAVVMLAAWLAGGALGGGRLASTGPPVWWTGAAAAGWLALVTVPGAGAVRWWLLRGTARTEQPAAAPSAAPDEGETRSRWERCTGLLARARQTVSRRRGGPADPPDPAA